MKAKIYYSLFVVIFLIGCARGTEDYPDEDYNSLFPFPGIEKPKISYEDQIVQLGDPDAPVSAFTYPGVEITENVRTYDVTLTCSFSELDMSGNRVSESEQTSRYVVRYVDTDKQLNTIATNRNDASAVYHLSNGMEYTLKFKASSGYPMYICVNGMGPRNSSIHARISAVSEDGFTIVKPLTVNQYQNEEGMDKIKMPYCAYIILP